MKKFQQLNRVEMKAIKGGVTESKCSAKCSDGSSANCAGEDCQATDNIGCTATTVDGNGEVSYQEFTCG